MQTAGGFPVIPSDQDNWPVSIDKMILSIEDMKMDLMILQRYDQYKQSHHRQEVSQAWRDLNKMSAMLLRIKQGYA